jgi:MoaA/NifB/PqqE/SkfB family radical SAM enzyme
MRRLSRVLGFFFRSRLLGHEIPLIASLKLTYKCNLACLACPFHLRSGEHGSHMVHETAIASLDRLAGMGCPIVVFEGGEPLLWSDGPHTFSDLVLSAKQRFVCTGATTNGTLDLDVPTDILWVSIDGTRDTHNHLRSNSYDRVMENLEKATHQRLYIHYTLNRMNWTDFPESVRIISSIPTVKGITVQLFYPFGQGEESLGLEPEERQKALKIVLELKDQGYNILNSAWSLKAMANNSWKCRQHLLANVDPDGKMSVGCYVKNRGEVVCSQCGFTPVAEASGAYTLVPGSLLAGLRIFL